MTDSFNLIYAKNCNIPKNILLNSKCEMIDFIINHIDDIDFISLNDVIIDKYELININQKLMRYLKLKKIYGL